MSNRTGAARAARIGDGESEGAAGTEVVPLDAARTPSTARGGSESIWAKLAAPVPPGAVSWRQDGRPAQRDGRFYARFVAYIEATTVRERLDAVVPGDWDLTLDLLPPVAAADDDGQGGATCAFKARLQILGVIREDVGTGRDYKAAATDAFKRAAVRFGVGHELYSMEPNWVPVDGDGRWAKPLEDPQAAYERRHGGGGGARANGQARGGGGSGAAAASEPTNGATNGGAKGRGGAGRATTAAAAANGAEGTGETDDAAPGAGGDDPEAVECPKCGGRMWDNRLTKRNPKAPDFKCRDRSCDGVIWPPRGGKGDGAGGGGAVDTSPLGAPGREDDDLPF